ncbi:MAG: flagellar basal body rod protein FlgG, partial [Pseudomonadota bacterium]
MRSMNIAATGMLAQQLNVEVISNNIANMNTTGFKRQRAEFQDLIYQNIARPGATTSESGSIDPTGVQVGYGVKTGSVYRVTEQGSLTRTDNRYDM